MNYEKKAMQLTDIELQKLESRIEKEYERASRELQSKFEAYLERSKTRFKEYRILLNEKKITQGDYDKAVKGLVMEGKRWEGVRDNIANEYTKLTGKTADWISQTTEDVFGLNYSYAIQHLEAESGISLHTSFTVYNKQAVDRILIEHSQLLPKPKVDVKKALRWNQEKIESAVLQGILQGSTIDDIANKLKDVTDMNTISAIRNARTAITSAENGARQAASHDNKELLNKYGYTIMKEWIATSDGRTRDEHAEADGQVVEIEEPFDVGGEELMYPGDMAGSPWNVYNCRCRRQDIVKKVEVKGGN